MQQVGVGLTSHRGNRMDMPGSMGGSGASGASGASGGSDGEHRHDAAAKQEEGSRDRPWTLPDTEEDGGCGSAGCLPQRRRFSSAMHFLHNFTTPKRPWPDAQKAAVPDQSGR